MDSAARIGPGVSAEATITIRNARLWSTIPSASPGIGSPKTMIPPAMAETFAAALVIAINGTASAYWSPQADA